MSGSGEAPGNPGRSSAASARLLSELVTAADGDRPAVTVVGPHPGQRTELGCATLSNWADKTANLLVEELELDAGDELAVDVGSDWTTLVVLLGAWRAGVVARLGDADPASGPAVVHEQRAGSAPVDDDVVVVGGGMAGRHLGDVHGGLAFATDVLSMPDEFTASRPAPSGPALRLNGASTAHEALARAGQDAARLLGVPARGRVASARRIDRLDGLVVGPLAAWAAAGSVLLVADAASLADTAAAEHADVTVGITGQDGEVTDLRCDVEEGAVRVSPR
jgi:uncharacterized protein (TIGR03089 family)